MGQQQQEEEEEEEEERVLGTTDPHKRPETTRSGTEKCFFFSGGVGGFSVLICAAIALLSDK
jgi:hypothetical protein